jgi:Zn-finger nucleic acid-binding protein
MGARDRELMEKMRQRHTGELHCPQCNGTLTAETVAGFAMMSCPNGHGAWLDKASVDRISKRG